MQTQNHGLQAVIFDLSGTVLDFGSRGPVAAIVELFARHGVALSEAEARGPMGIHKRDHIWALLSNRGIAERWTNAKGAAPDQVLLDSLYAELIPLQVEILEKHCELIPGVLEVTAELDRRGVPFSATTGFDSQMMSGLIRSPTAQGFRPRTFVCPDMVGGGRPAPWMAFHAAREMGVYPITSIVKVGDTFSDIEEAKNAAMWPVTVAASGNEMGLSHSE